MKILYTLIIMLVLTGCGHKTTYYGSGPYRPVYPRYYTPQPVYKPGPYRPVYPVYNDDYRKKYRN